MYFPSPLPTTRLSVSTAAVPVGPAPALKTTVYKTPGRPAKGKFKDSLGGVQEEEGEEILSIARGPAVDALDGSAARQTLWAALGREELTVWSIRPKVVLAKIRRTPFSLRTHGSNAEVQFHHPDRIVVTTSNGTNLLYSVQPAPASRTHTAGCEVYVLPGQPEKAVEAWPKGPGEGHELAGIVLKPEGERIMAAGDGVGAVCMTDHDLLIGVQDPPSLRIVPFPAPLSHNPSSLSRLTFSRQPAAPLRRGSGWDSLPAGLDGAVASETTDLREWTWLVGRDREDVTITHLIPLPDGPDENGLGSAAPGHPPYRRGSAAVADPYLRPRPVERRPTSFVLTTSDGRAYIARWAPEESSPPAEDLAEKPATASTSLLSLGTPRPSVDGHGDAAASRWSWSGICFHPSTEADDEASQEAALDRGKGASAVDVTAAMDLIAVGCEDGTIAVYSLPASSALPQASASSSPPEAPLRPAFSHECGLRASLNTTASALVTGRVECLAWTSDGYGLACGWSQGWSVWSVFGRLGSWSVAGGLDTGFGVEGERSDSFEDGFMSGVRKLFWGPGNHELFVLSHDEQLFVVPFAKSAVTAVHSPDNTKNGFLQLDDRLLVYRGADQPDMSVINPESDIPNTYLATQYPIRYALISSDARLIAVAGRRGFTHYNALSGRWKLFDLEREEQSLRVVGGMAWWSSNLIVGCEENGYYSLRIFARDRPLALEEAVELVTLESEPLVLSVYDGSLLVYTADNTFHHFLLRHVKGTPPRLRGCGSIGFEGVIADPRKVRGLSWLVPKSQRRFGDPADDLNVATIIFLISGRLVLLRPRRAASEEVKYDMQILADRVEFYWTHLSGIGSLENSLWGWDGRRVRIWLDALTIERVRVDARRDVYESVKESVEIPLDFYPLAVLMDKGIVVGVDQEISLRRNLDFAIFRLVTTTHLFLHHILRFHLDRAQAREAVAFASRYAHLVYFPHALEVLLHEVLEDEVEASDRRGLLARVIEFLDHFDECLHVVVNCARKTEVTRWEFLFDIVGQPRDLFEKCIAFGFHKVAASYLLVLHNLEPLEQSSKDTMRLLQAAMKAEDWTLCRELLRFLYSLDRSGQILRTALSESQALPESILSLIQTRGDTQEQFRLALTSPERARHEHEAGPLGSPPPMHLPMRKSFDDHRKERAPPPTGRLGTGLGLAGVGDGVEGGKRDRRV
ncbi:WD40 repeat protein [Rhodotorula sphaerocarpa]